MNVKLLDCTLRDGGFALEDAEKNGISTLLFSDEMIKSIAEDLSISGIDIIELGAMEEAETKKRKYAIYSGIEDLSETRPSKAKASQMYAAFFRGPDIPLKNIPDWNENLCEVVRVIIRYSEQEKSLDYCKALSQKGYKVFIQPMLTMRYSEEEIQRMIIAANEMEAYALYFVDSYGYMEETDIKNLYNCYNAALKKDIHIGFHAHNNMNMAYANAISFLKYAEQSDRNVIIDACCLGMGQGAGNLQTELATNYLNQYYNKRYEFSSVLNACENIEKIMKNTLWGYSLTNMLPALHKVAYKYSAALRNRYKMSYEEIHNVFCVMPDSLRHRYTEENVVLLLEHYKKVKR